MNIREFAALCGVAHSTVSRVLNQPWEKSRTSKITYERIRAKAAEVGFQVNYYARALHSRNSNCLGLIIGGWMPLLTEPILYGLTHSLNMQEKHVVVLHCDATPQTEMAAFEKMLIYNVETVLYIPARQKGKSYSTRHIQKVLEKSPQYPPVITLYGGIGIRDFYQIGCPDYETGRQAALRQLKNGCRGFGLIQPLYRNFMYREMSRGYRETLRGNGVPAAKIRELFFWMDGFTSDPVEALRDVDGIWCSHYVLLLHSLAPPNRLAGNCKRLHVDTICGTETWGEYRNLQPFCEGGAPGTSFPDWFGSMTVYQYNAREIGVKAAEITLQLAQGNTAEIPRISHLTLTALSFGQSR